MNQLPEGTPHWMQTGYFLMMCIFLFRQHINSRKIDNVDKEIKTNGGRSIKDRSDQTATFSELMTKRMDKAEKGLTQLKDWFARDRLHEKRQDWNNSKLRTELEQYEVQRDREREREKELNTPPSGD